MLRTGRLDSNYLTIGPKAMATMMNAKRCSQSLESEHHVGRPSCGVPRTTNPENPLDRAHPNQPGYFAGSRCPALPTTGGLANRGASCLPPFGPDASI